MIYAPLLMMILFLLQAPLAAMLPEEKKSTSANPIEIKVKLINTLIAQKEFTRAERFLNEVIAESTDANLLAQAKRLRAYVWKFLYPQDRTRKKQIKEELMNVIEQACSIDDFQLLIDAISELKSFLEDGTDAFEVIPVLERYSQSHPHTLVRVCSSYELERCGVADQNKLKQYGLNFLHAFAQFYPSSAMPLMPMKIKTAYCQRFIKNTLRHMDDNLFTSSSDPEKLHLAIRMLKENDLFAPDMCPAESEVVEEFKYVLGHIFLQTRWPKAINVLDPLLHTLLKKTKPLAKIHDEICDILASRCFEGYDIPKDLKKAFHYFSMNISGMHQLACHFQLGYLHRYGIGTPRNPARSKKYFETIVGAVKSKGEKLLSASNGADYYSLCGRGYIHLGQLELEENNYQVALDRFTTALRLTPEIKAHDSRIGHIVADHAFIGMGTCARRLKDYQNASTYFLAAISDNTVCINVKAYACLQLADMYIQGQGMEKSPEKAQDLIQMAAGMTDQKMQRKALEKLFLENPHSVQTLQLAPLSLPAYRHGMPPLSPSGNVDNWAARIRLAELNLHSATENPQRLETAATCFSAVEKEISHAYSALIEPHQRIGLENKPRELKAAALLGLAQTRYMQQQFEQAETIFENLANKWDTPPVFVTYAWLKLGDLHARNQAVKASKETALEYYQKAAKYSFNPATQAAAKKRLETLKKSDK